MAAEKKTEKKTKAQAAPAADGIQVDTRNSLEKRGIVAGTVVSDKMEKTIVVKVDRRIRHRMYKKYVTKSRRYKAHDELNTANIGDLVELVESRPLSRDKRWVLRKILRKAGEAAQLNV